MKDQRGTYCIIIERQLITAACPLSQGTCMWKHRIHGGCTYDEEFANSTIDTNEFAKRVGLPQIEPDIVNILRRSLIARVKDEVST